MRLHPKIRRRRILTGLLYALCATPAAAQQYIAGSVVEGGASTPVGGAMVVVLEGERVVAQALTGRNGNFRISVPRPGRFELRVDRIGYESTYTGPFDLSAGATVVRSIESRVQAVTLVGIDVEGEGRCEVRPEGRATAILWEEARKALAAAAWTRERGLYRFAWTRFVRELSADGRSVLSEQRSVRSELAAQPFISVEPEILARDGFVVDRGDSIVYAAPDARVLLSDEFLDAHCFSLDQHEEAGEQLVGLRFQPLRGSRLADVEGVLWLGRQTLRLRSVEYRYVNLPWRIPRHSAGGEVFYRALPNGTWIVNEWTIRMLRLSETRSRSGEFLGHELLGYLSEGSVVNVVATSGGEVVDRETGLGGLRGVVVDSAARPVVGARVWIKGTDYQIETGLGGRFAFDGIAAGVWTVGASYALLERVGHAGTFQNADVQRGAVSDVRVELPSVRAAALARCEGKTLAETTRVLVGTVVDEGGQPLRGAFVRALWLVAGLQEGIGVDTDESGRFVICGVPRSLRVRAWATLEDVESAVVQLAASPDDVATLEFEMIAARSLPAPDAPPPSVLGEEETWLSTKGFGLRAPAALLHQTRSEFQRRGLETLQKILTQAPRVEAKELVTGRIEYRLHAFESWRTDPVASVYCPLEFYLNGNLVRANFPALLTDYSAEAGRGWDLRPLDLDLWLLPRHITAVEIFDGGEAPVNVPGGCGAALIWVHRLDHLEDPEFTGSLSGRVLLAPENLPVEGVLVTVQPGGLERRTDPFGRFDFGFLPAARYRVEVAAPGWGTFTNEVMLRAGGRAQLSIQVEPVQQEPSNRAGAPPQQRLPARPPP